MAPFAQYQNHGIEAILQLPQNGLKGNLNVWTRTYTRQSAPWTQEFFSA
jgi:hypothetical protein